MTLPIALALTCVGIAALDLAIRITRQIAERAPQPALPDPR